MLTLLSTVKTRLAISEADTTNDSILTSAIKGVSARFDKETHRTLARTENVAQEFDPEFPAILARSYPIESVSKFELKTTEAEGWLEQTGIDYLIRESCVIRLVTPLATSHWPPATCRVTYTGGYVLPGTTPGPGQTPLPDDLEQAAVEQVAFWFQKRDKLGLRTTWPSNGEYKQFADLDLLRSVSATLRHYERITL